MVSRPASVRHRAAVLMLSLSCAPPFESATPSEPLPKVATDSELQPSQERTAAGVGQLRQLEVPGFGQSVLFVPAGTDARPLLVAAHGAGGTPEWECEYW